MSLERHTWFSDYTGQPFSVTTTSLNANGSTNFADCIGQPIKTPDVAHWYDPSTFASGPPNAFGNCGKNTLRGPGVVNADVSVTKKLSSLSGKGGRWQL